MSRVLYTSDLHLGHRKVAELRGFDRNEDHDESIAHTWREHVRDDDLVYVLGDISIEGSYKHALRILAELPGRKRLITGNHDPVHLQFRDAHRFVAAYADVFETFAPYGRRRINGQNVLLSRYPYLADHTEQPRDLQWRLPDLGLWLLHGHTHSPTVYRRDRPRQLDVGWYAWRAPVEEQRVAGTIANVEAERPGSVLVWPAS